MSFEKVLLKVATDIEQFGWHCLSVAPRAGEPGAIFSYTIGVTASYNHPEIMVFGLQRDRAHAILAECVAMIKNGTRFELDHPNFDVLAGGYEVIFKRVLPTFFKEYLGTATRHYGKSSFDAYVLFWPNKDHQFRWSFSEETEQSEALCIV